MSTSTPSSPTLSKSERSLLLSLSVSELEAWLMQLPLDRRATVLAELNQRITELEAEEAASRPNLSTPGQFARSVSRGRWKLARHLELLDRLVIAAICGTGSRRLIVTMPPRHGKSEHCSHWTSAWFVGTYPDKRVILTSYEAKFAEKWGGKARATLADHGHLFGVKIRSDSRAKSSWWIQGRDGGMETAGAGGAITGKGADLLLVDDPIKNAEEAASEARREAIWEWWTSTAYTRLEPDGVAIVIQTRWHEDDLAGRLIRQSAEGGAADKWTVVNLPAICEEPGDPLGRRIGAALWPERYSVERLHEIKASVGSRVWASLFQQRPSAIEGDFFKRDWFKIVPDFPREAERAVLYWDKAGTEGDGDYSAGVLMVEHDGIFYIVDVVRGQWSPRQRNVIMGTAAGVADSLVKGLVIWTEQEPGSGGKESADLTIRQLAGYTVRADKVTGSKEVRAAPFAAQLEAGNVRLVKAPWNKAFIDELCAFPRASHDDQVDAAAGAFAKLAKPRRKFGAGA